MKGKDYADVFNCVENEGFDYAFTSYTDFSDIEDEKFHELRKAFLQARTDLVEYCGLEL